MRNYPTNIPFSFPCAGGVIEHPTNDRKFYLRFEVKKFDEAIPCTTTVVQKVGKYLKKQHIQKWSKVTAEELQNVKVVKLMDESGDCFLSDTSVYVPEWLRDMPAAATSDSRAFPVDENLMYTVENNPASPDMV